jgi:hypothetical protein
MCHRVPFEQPTGFEPARAAWEAAMLPLHHGCMIRRNSQPAPVGDLADCNLSLILGNVLLNMLPHAVSQRCQGSTGQCRPDDQSG